MSEDDSRIQRRQSRYQDLAPIFARIAQALARDFVRLKGMSPEDADVAAIQIALDQARDTLVGMDELDEAWKPSPPLPPP